MKIYSKPVNNGETFCCRMKPVKDLFRNTPISISFAGLGREYGAWINTPYYAYMKNRIKGRVVCEMTLTSGCNNAILCFYPLKNELITDNLKRQFEQEFLPQIFEFYNANRYDENITKRELLLTVEIRNSQFYLQFANMNQAKAGLPIGRPAFVGYVNEKHADIGLLVDFCD